MPMYSIGIFASEYSLHNIMKIDTVLRRQCKVTYFPYTSMEHLVYLYRENAAFLDGMIFGGAFPYHIIHEQMKVITKPCAFFTLSDRDYFRIIAKIAIHYPGIDFSRIYFDQPDIPVDFHSVFSQKQMPMIGIEDNPNLTYWDFYGPSQSFYKKLWDSGKVDLIVTRFSSMRDFFHEHHIKYDLLLPSKEVMVETLNSLLLQLSSRRIHDTASCIGIFSVSPSEYSPAHQKQLLDQIQFFNQKIGNQFLVRSHDKLIEVTLSLALLKELTQDYSVCPVCAHLSHALPFPVLGGWGCGSSLKISHCNATRALEKARQGKNTTSCVAISERIIIGPLYLDSSQAAPENKPLTLSDVCLKTGLRPSLIEQLANASKALGKSDFSASDLAEYLHLSQRNVSRILNTLEVNGYASSSLHRIPGRKGRPEHIFTLFLSSSSDN